MRSHQVRTMRTLLGAAAAAWLFAAPVAAQSQASSDPNVYTVNTSTGGVIEFDATTGQYTWQERITGDESTTEFRNGTARVERDGNQIRLVDSKQGVRIEANTSTMTAAITTPITTETGTIAARPAPIAPAASQNLASQMVVIDNVSMTADPFAPPAQNANAGTNTGTNTGNNTGVGVPNEQTGGGGHPKQPPRGADKKQPPPQGPSIVIRPDGGTPPDSVAKTQTFTVQVILPPGAKTPDTITVKVDNKDKLVNGSSTVTLVKGSTNAKGTMYLSDPIKIQGKDYWFDWITVNNGGTLTATYDGTGKPVSTTFTVYDTRLKQAIGRNEKAFTQVKPILLNTIAAADKVIAAFDSRLKTVTNADERKTLEAGKQKAQDAKNLAQAKLAVMDQYWNAITWANTHDTGPLYLYTDQYKFWLGYTLLPHVLNDTSIDVRDISSWVQTAQNTASVEIDEIKFEATKLLAVGIYQATAELSLAGPVWTLLSPVTTAMTGGGFNGMTIWGTEAKGDDYLSAASSLLMAAAMMKGIPLAVDALGEAIAPGYGGGPGGFEFVLSSGGAGEGKIGVGDKPVTVDRAKGMKGAQEAVVNDAMVKSGLDDIDARATEAKKAGANAAEVDKIVQDAKAAVNSPENGVSQLKAIAQADFDIAKLAIQAKNPNAVFVTDPQVEALIRTVKTKAALEANGRPQIWTPEEANRLQLLNNNAVAADNGYFVDDPFVTGNDINAGIDFHGVEKAISLQDAKNIAQVAKMPVTIVDPATGVKYAQGQSPIGVAPKINTPPQGVPPKINTPQGVPPKINTPQGNAPAVTGDAPTEAGALRRPVINEGSTGPNGTQVLKAGENPYAMEKPPNVDPRTGASVNQQGKVRPYAGTGERGQVQFAGGQMTIENLRKEVGRKVAIAQAKTQKFSQSPIGKQDVGVLTPENIKNLTPEELQRITPENIRQLPPDLRDALPVDKLNADQLRALDISLDDEVSVGPQATSADIAQLNELGRSLLQWSENELGPLGTAARRNAMLNPPVRREVKLDETAPDPLAPGTTVALVATGASQGNAFEVQAYDASGHAVTVTAPPGLVLQPMAQSPASSIAKRLSRFAGTQPVEGYCLQFGNPPPVRGMLYKVADDAIQRRFAGVRSVLQAADKLKAAGRLRPDSDPKAYFDSITQFAVWTKVEGWTEQQFTAKFIEHTKQILAAANRPWTSQVEDILRTAAPHRWEDVQQVLQEASEGKAQAR